MAYFVYYGDGFSGEEKLSVSKRVRYNYFRLEVIRKVIDFILSD